MLQTHYMEFNARLEIAGGNLYLTINQCHKYQCQPCSVVKICEHSSWIIIRQTLITLTISSKERSKQPFMQLIVPKALIKDKVIVNILQTSR